MRLSVIVMIIVGVTLLKGQEKQKLTVQDIFGSEKFATRGIQDIHWLADGSGFTFLGGYADTISGTIYHYDLSTGEKTIALDNFSFKYNGLAIDIGGYEWSPDEKHLLISGQKKKIWRRSRESSYYLYDIQNKNVVALANGNASIQNAKISPDGKSVGYVLDNNLYVADIQTAKARALTNDGSEDILNAVFDWVYEEEFGSADAWRWSPDGKKIAFWKSDQRQVKSFVYSLDQLPRYNVVHALKYPKVGEANSIVSIGVVDVETGETKWMDLGKEKDIYIPRIKWTHSAKTLAIERLNRKQNKMELLFADVSTGKTKLIATDTDPAWVDVTDDLFFLKKKDQFIWTSEKSGYRHIYLFDYNGKLVKQLTSGEWEVESVARVDEANGWVYFHGKKETPLERHIYRVRLDGSDLQKISREAGWHEAHFSPDFQYYVDEFSSVKTPPKFLLCNSDGETIRVVEDNPIEALDEYQLIYPEFLTFKTTDGVELNAYMMRPADFDPAKKYPVLVYGYGGPGSQMVVNRWGTGSAFRHFQRTLWHQLMTEKGYIVFCVDNRGTGGRGKAFKNLAYGDISKWAVSDQIEGAKYLASLPFVDASRIGFWGWSGGGYLTCMILTRGADYFKAGVAVASVSDFRNYDTIWTERYMGLLSENEQGYDKANVLNYANLLKGKLMLIHGSGDDNVHFQNTIQFAQKLIDQDRQFDLMVYPNKNHRIRGGNTQKHLFTKITNYILKNL